MRCKHQACACTVHTQGAGACALAQVAKVLGEAMDKFGRLDGVVNCTGNMTMKPAHLTGEEEFMEGLRINALSSLNVLAAAVRRRPQAWRCWHVLHADRSG